jgi:hypothetical protein
LDTREFSTVNYPSCIFLLERPGTFPYERFAYNALRIGVEALNAANLPDHLEIGFDVGLFEDKPWSLNAEVTPIGTSTSPAGYGVKTSPFTPLVLFGIIHRIGNRLLDSVVLKEWQYEPQSFVAEIQAIGKVVAVAVGEYRTRGLGYSLRTLIERFDLSLSNIYESVDDFDVSVQFIVYHEIAHAYVDQFAQMQNYLPNHDFRAFEFIADLVATSWIYSGLIVNTLDSSSYREMRGFSTHAESIRENTKWVLRTQLIVLVFLALSSAVHSRGRVSLEGGPLHPHTYLRYTMQQLHFMTLVLSNYKDAFTSKEIEAIDTLWSQALRLFITTGLVPVSDLNVIFDDTRFADIRRAAAIAQELDISELRSARPFLAQLEAFSPKSDSDMSTLRFVE